MKCEKVILESKHTKLKKLETEKLKSEFLILLYYLSAEYIGASELITVNEIYDVLLNSIY